MNTPITAILVDDETKALLMLESKLTKFFPEIKIIGKYDDPEKAIEDINMFKPHILFLDINMPAYSGFELLQHIYNPFFEVVFVTAYDNHALEAIKHAASGYVLKPIDDSALKEATLNALKLVQRNLRHSETTVRRISIPFSGGFAIKSVDEIIHLEGFGGYTKIYLMNEVITSSYNIGLFNKMLNSSDYRMVHKSHLVNMKFVDKYLNEGVIVLTNGQTIPVSRANKQEIAQFFKANY